MNDKQIDELRLLISETVDNLRGNCVTGYDVFTKSRVILSVSDGFFITVFSKFGAAHLKIGFDLNACNCLIDYTSHVWQEGA